MIDALTAAGMVVYLSTLEPERRDSVYGERDLIVA